MPITPQKMTLSPLNELDKNDYKSDRYQYPKDIETLAHAIIFYINVNSNSTKYNNDIVQKDQSISNKLREKSGGVQNIDFTIPSTDIKFGTLRKTRRIKTNIALYVPENMIYDYGQSYETPSLTEYAKSFLENLPGKLGKLGKFAAGAVDVVKKYAPLTGYALNPVIEVLYSSPTLRQFQFDFTFAPRSSDEADQVMNIIKQFRMHQAPEVANFAAGMFFIPPSEFDIEFQMNINGSFVENPNVPRISTCVLTAVNVNYAPDNQFVTFKDGVPIQIQMRLAFQEVDMITRDRVELGF